MSRHSKSVWKNWKLWIGVTTILIVIAIMGTFYDLNKETSSNSIQKVENKTKKITDEEIIEFAKEEIKKKLRYPETARFKLKKLDREQWKSLVDIYSISKDTEGDEGRLEFVVRIEETNNGLKYVEMGSNNDTCNVDVAKEFEQLMKNCDHEQVYNELFTSNLKKKIKLEEFKSYGINMYATEHVTADRLADNSILTSFYDSINRKSYLVTIKNGMITKFQQV